MPPAKFRIRIAGGVWKLTKQANVLGELHVHMRVGLGVVEQHPVLACLLDHARVQVVQLCQLLGRFCVSANHACEERLRIVAVARDKVDSPRGGDACNGGPEAHLITNESAQFSNFLSDNPNARNGSGGNARRGTYANGLVDGVAVAVGVFIVGKSALLAGERGSARPGSSHCGSAE
jgi:hypothetical protein